MKVVDVLEWITGEAKLRELIRLQPILAQKIWELYNED